jgi:hypothetical protein
MQNGRGHMLKRIHLSISILLIVVPCSAWASNYFSWNADSWVTSRGACDTQRGTLDTSEKHSGASSLRQTADDFQGQEGCQQLDNTTIPGITWNDGGTTYYRWWMKISPSFNWGSYFRHFKANRTFGGGAGYTLGLDSNKVALDECAECLPLGDGDNRLTVSYDFNPGTNPKVSNWQEYIVAVKRQTGNNQNATLSLYVNGTLVGTDRTAMRLRNCAVQSNCNVVQDSTWGMFGQSFFDQLCANPGGTCPGVGGNIWVDDLSMDDRWNSTVGSQPLPPTLLPVQ